MECERGGRAGRVPAGSFDSLEDGVRQFDAGAAGDYVRRGFVSAGGSLSGNGCDAGAGSVGAVGNIARLCFALFWGSSISPLYFSLNSTKAPVVS
jgi:hypothetical protein